MGRLKKIFFPAPSPTPTLHLPPAFHHPQIPFICSINSTQKYHPYPPCSWYIKYAKEVATCFDSGFLGGMNQPRYLFLYQSITQHFSFYDGPNGSLFISILLHNSKLLIPNSEICTANLGIRNCEVFVTWACCKR